MRNPFKRQQKALDLSPEVLNAIRSGQTNFMVRLGGTNQRVNAAWQRGLDSTYGWMYQTQPAVRTVVDYIARNVAQLPLKLYERVSDTERQREEDHPAAQSLLYPGEYTTRDQFIFDLVCDFLVYGNAYVYKLRSPGVQTLTLERIPAWRVTVDGGALHATAYHFWNPDGQDLQTGPENVIHWKEYNPQDPIMGLSRLETLRRELASDSALQESLVELAKNGLKGGHIERPLDAPTWSEEAAERFRETFRAQKRSVEEPILEEGMKYVQDSLTPKDAELLPSREFTEQEVIKLFLGPFGVKPDGDLAEQRKQLYSDILPPITNALACRLDIDILRSEYNAADYYFEFDLNEKLRGDIESRFSQMTAAAGRPWLTINEVRALENKPPVEDGDLLTIPLNVMLEGQGSPALPAPNVMPPQDPNKPPQDGSYREQPKALNGNQKALEVTTVPRRQADMARQRRAIDKAKGVLQRYYQRQAHTLQSKGLKTANELRWNQELGDDLDKLIREIVELEGGVYVSRLGGHDFDTRQVENYVKAMAEGVAEGLNRATQQDIDASGLEAAFERARSERTDVAAASIGTRATVFARQEAAKQSPFPERRFQTWVANTDRHAELDGVSVPLDSDWGGIEPGSEPNCACTAVIG